MREGSRVEREKGCPARREVRRFKERAGKVILSLPILFVFILAPCKPAHAISPFARKYDTSCNTCHVAYPKLNAFGEAFRLNGYRFPGKEGSYVKEKQLSLGAPSYKRVWPEAVWPGTIPAVPPVGFFSSGRFVYEEEGEAKTSLNFPQSLDLLMGGTFGESVSFFGGVSFFDEEEEDDVEVERLFLQFNDPLSKWMPEHYLSVKVGFFEPAAVPFSGHRRLTLAPYLLNDFTLAPDGFRLGQSQAGVELHGLAGGRFRYALGVVNGSGDASDDNSEKDVYARLLLKLGGVRMDEEILKEEEWAYEDNSLSLGIFSYVGRSTLASAMWGEHDDDFDRVGVDGRIIYDRLDLFGAYMMGNDDDPAGRGEGVDSTAWFVESDVRLYPWLFAALRYEGLEVDGRPDVERFVPSLVILARANLKFTIEGEVRADSSDESRFLVEVSFVY